MEVLILMDAHEKVTPLIIAIAGSPYQGQSKQVVMGSQAAFIVLFV